MKKILSQSQDQIIFWTHSSYFIRPLYLLDTHEMRIAGSPFTNKSENLKALMF